MVKTASFPNDKKTRKDTMSELESHDKKAFADKDLTCALGDE
jgi:hypothetical protein